MKPPPITLTCDCGESASVVFGERWTCPACGRVYDTSGIPPDEYRAIEAVARRYRRIGWALVGVVGAFTLFLALTNHPVQILVGLPAIVMVWFIYVRPLMRRRFRKALGTTPTWNLKADPPGGSGV